jgi:L-arabinose isomerase
MNVVKNSRAIERLKAEMAKSQWLLQHGIATASEEQILEGLAKNVGLSYLIARRLGFDFSNVDRILYKQVDQWQNLDDLLIEQEWGDCSFLKDYLAPEE